MLNEIKLKDLEVLESLADGDCQLIVRDGKAYLYAIEDESEE